MDHSLPSCWNIVRALSQITLTQDQMVNSKNRKLRLNFIKPQHTHIITISRNIGGLWRDTSHTCNHFRTPISSRLWDSGDGHSFQMNFNRIIKCETHLPPITSQQTTDIWGLLGMGKKKSSFDSSKAWVWKSHVFTLWHIDCPLQSYRATELHQRRRKLARWQNGVKTPSLCHRLRGQDASFQRDVPASVFILTQSI